MSIFAIFKLYILSTLLKTPVRNC